MVDKPEWTKPYLDYLLSGIVPDDEVERRQLIRRAKGYTIISGVLYKRSTSGIFQRYISQDEGIEILGEIHQGD